MSGRSKDNSKWKRLLKFLLVLSGIALACIKVLAVILRSREDVEGREPIGEDLGGKMELLESFDGTPLRVEILGEGPPLVLVHGWHANIGFWHYQRKGLAKGFRVITYEQRGSGLSGTPDTPLVTAADLAGDLDRVLDSYAPEGAVVVCHSMGGLALLKYAELFPDKMGTAVRGAAMLDTMGLPVYRVLLGGRFLYRIGAAVIQPLMKLALRHHAFINRVKDLISGTSTFLVAVRYMAYGPNASYNQMRSASAMARATDIRGPLMWLLGMAMDDLSGTLPDLGVPCLVVTGSNDRIIRPFSSRVISERVPGARLSVIPGSGHAVPIQRYSECNSLIEELAREAFGLQS